MIELPVHFIHSISRHDRFETMQHEIAQQGITPVYWPAVIDRQISFRGISRAHKQIVRFAAGNNYPMVCIAEDDIKFTAPRAWAFYMKNLPKDFDIYLGGIFHGHLTEDNLVDDFCGLTLYVINERFYQTFLSITDMDNLDRSLAHKGKYVVCNPMVCSQYGGWSDSKHEYVKDYDHYLVENNYTLYK